MENVAKTLLKRNIGIWKILFPLLNPWNCVIILNSQKFGVSYGEKGIWGIPAWSVRDRVTREAL